MALSRPRLHTGRMSIPVVAAEAGAALHGEAEGWAAWTFDPLLVVPAVLVLFVYLRGLDRWEERSRTHPWWRTVSFIGGVAIVLLALESPLHWLSEHHFTFHMVQHEVLMMLAAPLILLGAPTTPLLRGVPRGVRRAVLEPVVNAPAVRWVFRTLTHPATAIVVYVLVLYSWHFLPGWYAATLTRTLVHDVQHMSFLVAASLVWWNVIDPAPLHSRMPYGVRMLFLFVLSTPKAFMGAFIAFSPETFYEDAYGSIEPILDISLATDQLIGGMIMWVPSQMMYLLSMAAVFFVWMHHAEVAQRASEALADTEPRHDGPRALPAPVTSDRRAGG